MPSLHAYPPFYTRQEHPATLATQLTQWSQLILSYCRFHRIFRLDLGDSSLSHELWSDAIINRRLDATFQRDIVAAMVKAGSAAYDGPTGKNTLPSSCFIFFRKPEEWAESIYIWVSEKGHLNSIVTFYELTGGEDPSAPADIQDMPAALLRIVLAHLVKTNRAQVFKGTGAEGDGVKFFSG